MPPLRSISRAGASCALHHRSRAHVRGAVAVVQKDLRGPPWYALYPVPATHPAYRRDREESPARPNMRPEFNAPGLLHGNIVTSTIAKRPHHGHRHKRRPETRQGRCSTSLRTASPTRRWPTTTKPTRMMLLAPSGSAVPAAVPPTKIMFNGQPIALVVAETSEVARFAGVSLIQVEYEKETHITDVISAAPRKLSPSNRRQARSGALVPPPKTRGAPGGRLPPRRRPRPRSRILHTDGASQPNGAVRHALLILRGPDGKLTVYDKTQGDAERSALSLRRVRHQPEELRVISPFVGGGFEDGVASAIPGGACGARGARVPPLRARGVDSATDVRPRLPAGDDSAHRAQP